MGYTAHAAPMQMLFYRAGGSFPADFQGDAFVAMRGSWNRAQPSGYEVLRVRFKDGEPTAFEPFLTGFLTDGGRTHFARPVGLALANDGALLMSDDANGVIYRVTPTQPGAVDLKAMRAAAPDTAMRQQAARGNGVPLAVDRPQAMAEGSLRLGSPTVKPDGQMPEQHSAWRDNLSPGLTWTAVPDARSYVLVMEDADAKPVAPFVHWVAWNIPGDITQLQEGLSTDPRLPEPGLMQGRNSRGSTGYHGPRPPVGDAPHRYHFQLFALDTLLDLPVGADREQVLEAMQGHVLAKGTLMARYAQRQPPPK
jgi:Raf kinase inhibitor-like YbhB/YbcL family protein